MTNSELLTSSYFDEFNSYIAGVVSLIFNVALMHTTSKVKIFLPTVRVIQYIGCINRLLFSTFVVFTSPTLVYVSHMKAIYIVKGGFYLSYTVGEVCLIIFLMFVVQSSCGPLIQYLQVSHLLSSRGHSHARFGVIANVLSIFVFIPTLILVSLGYIASDAEYQAARSIVYYLNGVGDTAFLVIPVQGDLLAIICTFFIFSIFAISLISIILCCIYIKHQMNKKLMSPSSLKAQKQLNVVIFVQFALPFLTIHIPFYIAFILPTFDVEFPRLSKYLPYLFSWCPAINPILVILMVKNVRDRFFHIKTESKAASSTNFMVRVRN